jgi:hypothetical protein
MASISESGRRGQADFCCRLQPAARADIDILFARFFPHDVPSPLAEDLLDAWLTRRD